MRRLDELKRKEITQRDFEMFPVWTWGEDMESYVPLEEIDSPSEEYNGALFIRAKLVAGGHPFDGYSSETKHSMHSEFFPPIRNSFLI